MRGDIRKWQFINEIINKDSTKKDFPESFMINGVCIMDQRKIANEFNKYFVQIGPRLAESININTQKSFKDYLSNEMTLFFNLKK